MDDNISQLIERAVKKRAAGNTAAIVVLCRQSTGHVKAGIAFCHPDAIAGKHEHEAISELCRTATGDVYAVSVYRWAEDVSDATILMEVMPDVEARMQPEFGGLSIPYRRCWGELQNGDEYEQVIQMTALRLAHCREQLEESTSRHCRLPVGFQCDRREPESSGHLPLR